MDGARTALVTGGARGHRRAIVRRWRGRPPRRGRRHPDEAAAETAASVDGLAVHLDVTDTASVDHAVSRPSSEFGPIAILVNNAGWDEFRPFLQTTSSSGSG